VRDAKRRRAEPGFARRERKCGYANSLRRRRGLVGNHGFPHGQNIEPMICEKRITVTVSSSLTGRL
jgi:hypothetical protein